MRFLAMDKPGRHVDDPREPSGGFSFLCQAVTARCGRSAALLVR